MSNFGWPISRICVGTLNPDNNINMYTSIRICRCSHTYLNIIKLAFSLYVFIEKYTFNIAVLEKEQKTMSSCTLVLNFTLQDIETYSLHQCLPNFYFTFYQLITLYIHVSRTLYKRTYNIYTFWFPLVCKFINLVVNKFCEPKCVNSEQFGYWVRQRRFQFTLSHLPGNLSRAVITCGNVGGYARVIISHTHTHVHASMKWMVVCQVGC